MDPGAGEIHGSFVAETFKEILGSQKYFGTVSPGSDLFVAYQDYLPVLVCLGFPLGTGYFYHISTGRR